MAISSAQATACARGSRRPKVASAARLVRGLASFATAATIRTTRCPKPDAIPPAIWTQASSGSGASVFLTVLVEKNEGTTIPTIAIIGGGTGGNLLAARLLERATSGQRLNVMLIEARGRAGPQPLAPDRPLSRVHSVPSEATTEVLSAPVEALAARLASELGAARPASAA